jgi:outer membrane protein assembly factor BamB
MMRQQGRAQRVGQGVRRGALRRVAPWAFLLALGAHLTADGAPEARAQPFNRYLWQWEAAESRDVMALEVSADGRYLVAASHSWEGSALRPNFGPGAHLVLFDTRGNRPLWDYELPGEELIIYGVACSNSAEIIACVANHELFVLDRDGELLWRRQLPAMGDQLLDVSGDGRFLAVSSYHEDDEFGFSGPHLYYFDVSDSEPLWGKTVPKPFAMGVRISDDGRFVVLATVDMESRDPSLYCFDNETQYPMQPSWQYHTQDQPSNRTNVALSADGRFTVLQANNRLFFFSTEDPGGAPKEPLWIARGGGYGSTMHSVELSADGALLAHAGPYIDLGGYQRDGVLELWDTTTGEKLWTFTHTHAEPHATISRDGRWLALCGNIDLDFDPLLAFFSADSPEPLWTSDVMGIPSISGDGTAIGVGAGVGTAFGVRVYDPLYAFRRELNEPPLCAIEAPADGAVVSGVVEVRGTAEDPEEDLVLVQVGPNAEYQDAEDTSGTGDWSSWRGEIDFSHYPNGEVAIRAESVDARWKHSAPAEIRVLVNNPTPQPTWTPFHSPTPSPTISPTPSPSPTPRSGPLSFTLELNQSIFIGGDILLLVSETRNEGQSRWVLQYVVLEVYGTYYYHPWWEEEPEATTKFIPEGEHYREPLLAVGLPYDLEPAGPFFFLGVLVDEISGEMIGNVAAVPFVFL